MSGNVGKSGERVEGLRLSGFDGSGRGLLRSGVRGNFEIERPAKVLDIEGAFPETSGARLLRVGRAIAHETSH